MWTRMTTLLKDVVSNCDPLDLPEEKVGDIQIKHNRFVQAISNFIEVDLEPNYSNKFIENNVKIEENEIGQKCNCTKYDLPNDPNDNEIVEKMFIESSR